MKLTLPAVFCLSLLLVHVQNSLAGKKGSLLKNIFKKPKPKTNLDSKTKDSILKKAKQPQYNQGGYPQQPAGGYPQYPARPGYPSYGGYPQYPARPGYPSYGGYPQYPARPGGYPSYGGYPQYPARPGGYPSYGVYPQFPGQGYGSYGNYPGSYINYNPNNRILSPHYGGSFGYGGYGGGGGGSPFSHSVQAMGYAPSDKSRGFGRTAVMAAAGGAMAGMALGYGLGRFPHPHFHFHSPQEEYFYNHYMYRKYGMKSTDSNDYSRDYKYTQLPETFYSFMASCMKRTDLLPVNKRKSENILVLTTTKTSTTTTVKTITASAPVSTGSNATNTTAAGSSSSVTPSTPHPLNKSEVDRAPSAASQVLQKDDDDDTVSIVEIGYPELIRQMKVKRCTELYVVYSEKYLKKNTAATSNAVNGLEMDLRGLLSVLTSSTLMLLNCNMLMLLH